MKQFTFLFLYILTLSGISQNAQTPPKPSLFLFTGGYRFQLSKSSILNSGKGLYFELGIKPVRFSNTGFVGVYGGWALQDKLWSTSFDKEFTSDYTASINQEHGFSPLDSSVISSSARLFSTKKGNSSVMPGCEMRSFHNYALYYGLIVKLPLKHSVFVKLYRGSTRSNYQGSGDLITSGKDYNILQLRRVMHGLEVMVSDLFTSTKKNHLKRLGLSIYYEYRDFTRSRLYFDDGQQTSLISLHRFTHRSFLEKYRHETVCGIKLSYNIM